MLGMLRAGDAPAVLRVEELQLAPPTAGGRKPKRKRVGTVGGGGDDGAAGAASAPAPAKKPRQVDIYSSDGDWLCTVRLHFSSSSWTMKLAAALGPARHELGRIVHIRAREDVSGGGSSISWELVDKQQ